MMKGSARLALVLAAIAGILLACAPATEREAARPVVVVVSGPTEMPLDGVAEAMREALRDAGFPGSFGPRVIEPIAQRRDLSRTRGVSTAAELGRIASADVALYVEVVRIDRDVETDRRNVNRRVDVWLQLRATLVDPASGAPFWSTRDVERMATRTERTTVPLARLSADPDVLTLRDRAVRALARDVVARLANR